MCCPSPRYYTDEYTSYRHLEASGYKHKRIHHSEKIYVSGDIHTNTIEGFFSLVKRGIGGVYHAVSKKHLQSYLSEYVWRYNNRGRAQFASLLLLAAARVEREEPRESNRLGRLFTQDPAVDPRGARVVARRLCALGSAEQ